MEKNASKKKNKDHLNSPYKDGILNSDGEMAIRPLTEEERNWLDKFNNEYIKATFNNDETDVHHNLIKENEKKVLKLKKQLKNVSKKLRVCNAGYRTMNSEEREVHKNNIKALLLRKNEIKEQLALCNVKGITEANKYARSVDISNSKRTIEIGDLSPKNFIYTEGENIKNASETELFDKLKNAPLDE